MPLSVGTRLGPYEILAPLGAGGMGEVYRARDTKLDRDVAIKILPEALAHDPERMARFEREAKVLASLNHPNIAQIYGIEQGALVMELVEGETLKGPLPLETALNYARQISEALEAAHEKNVTHRDLKPANIMITPAGVVKVLDFGLAAYSPACEDGDSTLTMSPTRAGTIMGTPAYLSPEQARGERVDKRADVWAFGVVLWEMLTGKRLFQGRTLSDVLAAVIRDEPDLSQAPAKVRPLLKRCLEKDPQRRLRDIGDAMGIIENTPEVKVGPAILSPTGWAVAAALALALIVVSALFWRATRMADRPLVRLDVDLGPDVSLGSFAGPDVIISPGGARLVYVSHNRLFTRRLDQPQAAELPGTEGATGPFFSPDGEWVAFFGGGKLKKVSVAGGAAIALCKAPLGTGGSWGEDGTIVVALGQVGGLSRIPVEGGAPAPLTELDRERGDLTHRWPQILPGGKAVLFTAHNRNVGGFDDASIEVVSLGNRRTKTLLRGGLFGRYLPSGHLLYINRGTLFAVPFELNSLEVRGAPMPILNQVAYSVTTGAAKFDASLTGTLVYGSGEAGGGGSVSVRWLESDGKTRPLMPKPGAYGRPSLSPDGRRLAMEVFDGSGQDIWIYDLERDTMTRMTFDGRVNQGPTWSPDGRYIVFGDQQGLSWTRADGAGKPEVLLQTPFDERYPSFSPDGKWLAYASTESGSFQVYIRAFPDKGGKWQISSAGGSYPMWSRSGRELFFESLDNRIMVAGYTAQGDSFVADKPRLWSEKALANLVNSSKNVDLAPDGRRIVAVMPAEGPNAEQSRNHVVFLENFFDELRRRAPVGK
jgi:WD40 repeat protein/predicted Ser/Thr protein kinase